MSEAPLEQQEEVLLWKNTADGNNHSLVFCDGTLTLTVVKPDGTKFVSERQATASSLADWKTAFEGLGPQWSQVDGSEQKLGDQYLALRCAETPTEVAEWEVDHTKLVAANVGDAQYAIADKFHVLLKE